MLYENHFHRTMLIHSHKAKNKSKSLVRNHEGMFVIINKAKYHLVKQSSESVYIKCVLLYSPLVTTVNGQSSPRVHFASFVTVNKYFMLSIN